MLDGFAPFTEMAIFEVLVTVGVPLKVRTLLVVATFIQAGVPVTFHVKVSVAFVEVAVTVAVYGVPTVAVDGVEVVTEIVGAGKATCAATVTVTAYVRTKPSAPVTL